MIRRNGARTFRSGAAYAGAVFVGFSTPMFVFGALTHTYPTALTNLSAALLSGALFTGWMGLVQHFMLRPRPATWLARVDVDEGEQIVTSCDFSPGPWWGFNGVETLVLTTRRLGRVRHFALRRTPSYSDLAELHEVRWRRRGNVMGGGTTVMLTLRIEGRRFRRLYATLDDSGAQFAEALRDAARKRLT